MKQNYFIYNGEKYYAGSVMKVKQWDNISGREVERDATFICSDTERDRIIFRIQNHTHSYPKENFNQIFIRIINKVGDQHNIQYSEQHLTENRKKTFSEELSIDGMLIAWMWYIFIMAATTIFNDRIGIWILTSIVFFGYRSKKLKERGYK